MSGASWTTSILCPLLGAILCNAMALAPFKAVIDARKKKDLGDLNPFPFALIMNSQLGWTIYGAVQSDVYIFFSSAPPFVLGAVLCMTAIHVLERGVQHEKREKLMRLRLEYVMFASVTFWLTAIFVISIVLKNADRATAAMIVGISSDISSLLYYGAPLATVAEVIRTKDSSSLFVPAIVISAINCILWFFYGLLGVQSALIYVPNIIGILLCVGELIVRGIYPAKSKSFEEKLAEETVEEVATRVRTLTEDFTTRVRTATEDFGSRVRSTSEAFGAHGRRASMTTIPEESGEQDGKSLVKHADGKGDEGDVIQMGTPRDSSENLNV